jgi:RNA polymerase sigma-70 factor, ECF subfamily
MHNRSRSRSKEEIDFQTQVIPLEPYLFGKAMKFEGSAQNARDLVQDTLERALRSFERFRPGTNLKAWLMTIMYNLYIDRYRRRRHEIATCPRVMVRLPSPDPDPVPEWQEISTDEVVQAVQLLDASARTVFERHFVQRQSYREISAELGVPQGTVGTRLLRARRKLREALQAA